MSHIMKNIYFVTNNMPRNHGGRTKSMLQRARLLTSLTPYNINILTTKYNNDYCMIWSDFKKRGLVNGNVSYINIYEDLMFNSYTEGRNNFIRKLMNLKVFSDNSFSTVFRTIHNAVSENQEKITSELILDGYAINLYYRSSVINKKELILSSVKVVDDIKLSTNLEIFVDPNNNILRICQYNNTGSITSEKFFDRNGIEYLNKRYTYEDEKKKLIDIRYKNGKYEQGKLKVFKSYRQLYSFWFDSVVLPNSFIVSDVRGFDAPLIDLKEAYLKNVYVACLFHNSHQSSKSYEYVINNYKKVDKIITLTHKQHEDLLDRVDSDSLFVIPHSIEIPKLTHENHRRNFVVIARLTKQKQINHILHAFREVLYKYPDYFLDIYGEGDQKNYLEQITIDLGIKNNVIFHGRVSNVGEIFQQAKCSIVSSIFEGFALTIQESLANGCPVVSYDVKYGPSDMIKHGINGFLVEQNNINELADYLNLIASDEASFDEEAVQKSIYKFSHHNFIEKWRSLLEES